MTLQENAAQLADGLAIVLAATQRSADTIREAPRGTIVWHFVDHCGEWHRMVKRLSPAEALGDRSAEFRDLIEEAEQVLFDGREPWVYSRKRKRFRESALAVLEKHGTIMHDAMLKARALAAGNAQ